MSCLIGVNVVESNGKLPWFVSRWWKDLMSLEEVMEEK